MNNTSGCCGEPAGNEGEANQSKVRDDWLGPQGKVMGFDPSFGTPYPYPSHADQYRQMHENRAWLFDPWTGIRRTSEEVMRDVFGRDIIPKLRSGPMVDHEKIRAQESARGMLARLAHEDQANLACLGLLDVSPEKTRG